MKNIRVGFVIGAGKMKLDYLTQEEVNAYLDLNDFFSICMDRQYYIFVDRKLDMNDEVVLHTMMILNQELMMLVEMDKKNEVR